MADTKLSALTELAATPANDDEMYIRDVSEPASAESKRITVTNLLAGAGGGGPTIVRKTADQTVNNSTALVNDNHLLLAIGANEIWLVKINLLIDSGTVPDIKFGWAYPTSCDIKWQRTADFNFVGSITTLEETDTREGVGLGAGTIGLGSIKAIVTNGANTGNLVLQWAQNTQEASNTKVLAGSHLIAWQLG